MRIATIVEGHGEVRAVPILVRRIAESLTPTLVPELPRPIRVQRNRLLKANELERTIELAARRAGAHRRILILLDADEDCPAELAPRILERATREDCRVHVVLANTEYEAWFLAAATSIAGHRGIRQDVTAPDDPEQVRDAKGWLNRQMRPHRYRETLDQPALTAIFDLESARKARSFEKMWREVASLLA